MNPDTLETFELVLTGLERKIQEAADKAAPGPGKSKSYRANHQAVADWYTKERDATKAVLAKAKAFEKFQDLVKQNIESKQDVLGNSVPAQAVCAMIMYDLPGLAALAEQE